MNLTAEKFVTTQIGWGGVSNHHSQKNYRNHLKQLDSFLNERNKTATDGTVTSEDLNDYLSHMQLKGFKLNTISCKIAVVKSYFKWLLKSKKITTSPEIDYQPSQPVTRQKVTQETIEKIFNLLDSPKNQNNLYKVRDAAMIGLMLCGLKTEQVVSLSNKQVNFETLKIRDKKGIFSFKKFVNKLENYALLKSLANISQSPEDPFFLNKFQNKISTRSLRRHLETYIKSTNSSQFSTLDLRWTWKCEQNAINVKNKQTVKEGC